jgi:hypothetical protein
LSLIFIYDINLFVTANRLYYIGTQVMKRRTLMKQANEITRPQVACGLGASKVRKESSCEAIWI